jgi:tRNA (guanine37-N1)-methyltransferase
MKVPEVLFSGDHDKISSWRKKKSLEKTWLLRPDLLEDRELSPEERKILREINTERKER